MPKMPYDIYSNKEYRLYAACLHSGSLTSGHYTAACLNYNTNQWMHYSDSHFSVLDELDFGNAYAVFYELCEVDGKAKKDK
jgi:ubiquitin C-terminal hydrolase